MDVDAVLAEVNSWPIEERIRLCEALKVLLADLGEATDLTEELKAELDRRLAEDDAAPDDVVPWEEVKAQALARARQ
jgi:putative addiction module component (TIGR02574 family)